MTPTSVGLQQLWITPILVCIACGTRPKSVHSCSRIWSCFDLLSRTSLTQISPECRAHGKWIARSRSRKWKANEAKRLKRLRKLKSASINCKKAIFSGKLESTSSGRNSEIWMSLAGRSFVASCWTSSSDRRNQFPWISRARWNNWANESIRSTIKWAKAWQRSKSSRAASKFKSLILSKRRSSSRTSKRKRIASWRRAREISARERLVTLIRWMRKFQISTKRSPSFGLSWIFLHFRRRWIRINCISLPISC